MILCIFLRIVHKKIQKVENKGGVGYNTVSHLSFFATMNKEQKSSYLQLCRRLNGKMLVLGFLYSKSTPIVQKKKKKNMSNDCVFHLILTNTSTLKIVRSKSPVHGNDSKILFPYGYRTGPIVYEENRSP